MSKGIAVIGVLGRGEQSSADHHMAVAKRMHALSKKHNARGDKSMGYKYHRAAAKHTAMAQKNQSRADLGAELVANEYGVPGQKWGQRKAGSGQTPLSRAGHSGRGPLTAAGTALAKRIRSSGKTPKWMQQDFARARRRSNIITRKARS